MDCGKTSARSRWFTWLCGAAIVRFHPNLEKRTPISRARDYRKCLLSERRRPSHLA